MDLIPKHGGYRNLKSFQAAQVVYDLTVRFCDRYIDKRSRTRDQMVQAGRSGVQLTRQIASLEKAFVEEGGFTERMYRVRSARRNRS